MKKYDALLNYYILRTASLHQKIKNGQLIQNVYYMIYTTLILSIEDYLKMIR